MGLGPPVIALYRQLKKFGVFDDVTEVLELGSQNVWCPHSKMLTDLYADFQRPAPSKEFLDACADWRGIGKDLYEGLGLTYNCVDTDGRYGAIELDINFDPVPDEHKNRYGFVTNHGTTEHLLNQANAFKICHDFTKVGGYILHALPFLGQLDHGFFNYQPNLFDSLARYNSYRNCGMWIGIAYDQSSFIPYHKDMLQHLNIKPDSTGLLVVLQQKMFDTDFQIPFQGVYEETKTEDVSSRYAFIVDGELYEGSRDTFITREGPPPLSTPATDYLPHIGGYDLARELGQRVKKKIGGLFGGKS